MPYRWHVKRAGLALLTVAIGVIGAALVALGLSTPPRPNPERISAVVFTRPPGGSVRLALAVQVDGRVAINALAPRTGNRDPLPDIAIVLHGDLRLHGIEGDQQLARRSAEVHDDVPCEDLEMMFGGCQAGPFKWSYSHRGKVQPPSRPISTQPPLASTPD